MREEPTVAADAAPPAAIMIELAEAPEAAMTEENEISPDQETAEANVPAEQVESAEEAPPEEIVEAAPEPVEPEPEEVVAEADPEEQKLVDEDVTRLDNVDVPIPTPRPTPPKPKKKEVVKKQAPSKKPAQRRQQQQAASKQAIRAQAQVKQSNRNAARQTASGVYSVSPAKWQSRLMAHLERRKRYPAEARRRGERGIVYVRFRIDERGNVQSVSLARSSGYPALDNEVLSLVRRASPVPAPPPGVNRTITAPVRFSVR